MDIALADEHEALREGLNDPAGGAAASGRSARRGAPHPPPSYSGELRPDVAVIDVLSP